MTSSTGLRPSRAVAQPLIFCAYGSDLPAIAGLCRKYSRRRAHSRRRFGGSREQVVGRHGYRRRVCGRANGLAVHHRHLGIHAPEHLITVCAACYTRLHRSSVLRGWLPVLLRDLWAEQHPQLRRQLQFGERAVA